MLKVGLKNDFENQNFAIFGGSFDSFGRKYIKKSYIGDQNCAYRKVASSNTSRLEAHAAFCRLLMKGIFEPYVL